MDSPVTDLEPFHFMEVWKACRTLAVLQKLKGEGYQLRTIDINAILHGVYDQGYTAGPIDRIQHGIDVLYLSGLLYKEIDNTFYYQSYGLTLRSRQLISKYKSSDSLDNAVKRHIVYMVEIQPGKFGGKNVSD